MTDPMTEQARFLAILFADICDSTRLYETVGDAGAHGLVAQCLKSLSEIIRRHGGTVIKTIGDGIMSTFPTADRACAAALEMQEQSSGGRLSYRVGFHAGPVIAVGGDVFGDAVNLAARVSGLARPGEILLTRDTVAHLSPAYRSKSVMFDTTTVKGKREAVDIFRIAGEVEDCTITAKQLDDLANRQILTLILSCAGQETQVSGTMESFSIGRDPACNLVVPTTYASRRHAVITPQRDRFVLTDQSTNGTFVVTQDGKLTYLKREPLQLLGSGSISLGIKPDANSAQLIVFRHAGGG